MSLRFFFRNAALCAALAFSSTCAGTPVRSPVPHGPRPIVTWGDSHANWIGKILAPVYQNVDNRGVDGAGLLHDIRPKSHRDLPPNAVVFFKMTGNDISTILRKKDPDAFVPIYATLVSGIARQMQNQGATVIMIGHQSLPAPYTEWDPSLKRSKDYLPRWNRLMTKINAELESRAHESGIAFCRTEGRIRGLSDDHLHYTYTGYWNIVRTCMKDAGVSPAQFRKRAHLLRFVS